MKPPLIIGYLCVGLMAMASVSAATVLWFDQQSAARPPAPLIIDASQVVHMFTVARGADLDPDAFRDALRDIDAIVTTEAARIFETTGQIIINADHVLAGGQDVTEAFSAQVVALWDASQ